MSKKILVIDDEPDVLKVEVFRIKKLGYDVLSADNGEDGLDLIRKERPDLVVLDLRMPRLEGSEVCLRAKSDPELKNIPIILVTASSEHIAQTVISNHADDYLLKPFEPEELAQKIEKNIK